MYTPTLHFKNRVFETLYKKYRWNFNKFPSKMLLVFNIMVQISIAIMYFTRGDYLKPFYSIIAFLFLVIFYKIYTKYENHFYFQEIFIIVSILVPFVAGTYFSCQGLEEKNSGGFEWYLLGFTFQMFFSYLYKLRINWYNVMFAKLFGYFFLLTLDLQKKSGEISDESIILCLLTVSGIYFDYIQDKTDRILWEKERISSRQNQTFRNLLEEIPDHVIIWNSKLNIIYANNSTSVLFAAKDYEILKRNLLEKIEILQFPTNTCPENDTNILFLLKIQQVFKKKLFENLEFIVFSAYLKNLDDETLSPLSILIKKSEYDIEMKKIFWENEEAVMVFLSKVDEKNLNSRLEHVNSFLNYVLGNVSHDIYTPLNVLLGMIENIIDSVKNTSILSKLFIAKNNGEILLNIIRIMIDLFNIRKGSLLLSISKVSLEDEIKTIFELFKEIFHSKKIDFKISDDLPTYVNTDIQRFREVIIVILSNVLRHMQSGYISFKIEPCDALENIYEITIDIKGRIQNDLSSPKSFKNWLYNQPNNVNLLRRSSENSQMNNSLDCQIDLDMSFALVDFIILCLSSGKDEHLRVKNEVNHEKKDSHIVYNFKIQDVISLEPLSILDPFKEKQFFSLKFGKNENKFGKNEILENSYSEFNSCQKIHTKTTTEAYLHQSPLFSCFHMGLEKQKEILQLKTLRSFAYIDNSEEKIKLESLKIQKISSIEEIQTFKKSGFLKKIRILNADDFYYNLMVISNYCKSCGLEVIDANNGREAVLEVEKLYVENKCSFDFIFMDCDMPIMDGFEAAEKINQFYGSKNIDKPPIVAITANVINDDITSKMQTSGMKEVIIKPLGIERFKEILNQYMQSNFI